MRKISLAALATALITLGPNLVKAVDFIYKDERGFEFYRCDNFGGGGRAKVKQVGKDKYLVYGGIYKGYVVPAVSAIEASRKACGEVNPQ